MDKIKKIHSFLWQHSWYTLGSNVTNFLSYANSILIGRLLGPAGLGDVGSFGAYLGVLTIPIAIVGTFVTQTSSLERHAVSLFNAVRHNMRLYVLGLLLLVVGSLIFSPVIASITKLSLIGSVLLLPDLWISLLTIPLAAITLGGERYKANVIASLLGTVVKISAVPVIAISHWYSSDISIIAISLGQMLTVILLWTYLHKRYPHGPSPSLGRIMIFARRRHFVSTIIGSASMILLVNLDIVVARHLFDGANAGIYATWSLLSKVVFFTLGPLLTVSFVKQSKKVNMGQDALDPSVHILILLCLASLIPLFVGYQYLAPIVLKFVFGSRFEALYQYLGLSGIFGAFTLLLNHLTNTHIARRSWMSVWTIVCVIAVMLLALVLHPSLSQYYLLINATVMTASLGLFVGLHLSVNKKSDTPTSA